MSSVSVNSLTDTSVGYNTNNSVSIHICGLQHVAASVSIVGCNTEQCQFSSVTDTCGCNTGQCQQCNRHICRSLLVSWCFQPSQSQWIISGLNTNCSLSPSYSFYKSLHQTDCKHSLIIPQVFFSKTTAQILSTIKPEKQ